MCDVDADVGYRVGLSRAMIMADPALAKRAVAFAR